LRTSSSDMPAASAMVRTISSKETPAALAASTMRLRVMLRPSSPLSASAGSPEGCAPPLVPRCAQRLAPSSARLDGCP
jgi:hypothetical protein